MALPAAVLLWAFLLGCTRMGTTDIWWHLRAGQLILQRREIPHTDWFTFTSLEQPWIDLHWGFQLLVTALHSIGGHTIGGVEVLVLAKATCLSATIAIGWLAAGHGLPTWMKALCWVLPTICLSGRALVRPEMLSLVFLALWLWLLFRLDRNPRLLWWLPVLQILWTNCHALFVLGLVAGAAYVADRIAREFCQGRWGLERAVSQPPPTHLFRAGLLVLLACLVNPYFEEGALFPLELYKKFSVGRQLYAGIGEFQRPIDFVLEHGLSNLYVVEQAALGLATALSFVWLAGERRTHVMRGVLFAAFSYLGWQASRNTGIFALVCGVVLCENCDETLRLKSQRPEGTVGHGGSVTEGFPRRLRLRFTQVAIVGFAGLILSVPTGYWAKWGGEGKQFGLGEMEHWYVHEAALFAAQPGFPRRAFVANLGQAAVYIFRNGPERKVFMDGRLEVASRETYQQFWWIRQAMARADRGWERVFTGELPAVILDSRFSRLEINGMLNTPGWRMVFADAAAAVFIEEKLADRLNLPQADLGPLTRPPGA